MKLAVRYGLAPAPSLRQGLRVLENDVKQGPDDRRRSPRLPTRIEVDYRSEDTYLFASITDISTMGIFVRTDDPLPQGALLQLRFSPPTDLAGPDALPFELDGQVVWVTADAPGHNGMGVRFRGVDPEQHHRLLDLVRKIAYLDEGAAN